MRIALSMLLRRALLAAIALLPVCFAFVGVSNTVIGSRLALARSSSSGGTALRCTAMNFLKDIFGG